MELKGTKTEANLKAAFAGESQAHTKYQYYAGKADYEKAIGVYERAFAADTRRPRFQDALMGIADIYEIMGDYANAAKTYDRIIDLLENEWGLTEETDSSVTAAKKEKTRLRTMA